MNKSNVLALVALVFVFPGVLHAFSQEKDGIKINVKDFMNDPYAQVMSNENWTITAEDLQKHNIAAIKVKVTNNTDKPICISGRSVRLSQVNPEEMAVKFKKRTIIRPILTYCGTRFIAGQVVETIAPSPKAIGTTLEEIWNDLPRLTGAFAQYNQENAGLLRLRWLIPFAGSIAYGFYLSDLNSQLEILIKQSSLNEMITIAPNQSVEKVILCEGMFSHNFKFNVLNRGQVPIAEFAVDLNA